jgi:hypothetical protein
MYLKEWNKALRGQIQREKEKIEVTLKNVSRYWASQKDMNG